MNSYYKSLNNKMYDSFKDTFIDDLQNELKNSIDSIDIHDFTINKCDRKNNKTKLDINLLLKYYILSQVIDDNEKDSNNRLMSTANANIKKDKNNNYYKKTEKGWELCNITKVFDNGDYIEEFKRNTSSIKIQKIYDKNDRINELIAKDSAGNTINNKNVSAELLGLKRELKKRYKLAGYSGNSKDFISNLLNMFTTPIETGFYIDIYCLSYKWRNYTSSFIRIHDRKYTSPLLVDIEFKDNGTAITQEYTGR